MSMKAYDAAEELTKLVEQHSKLKCPAGGSYAWEAGCLTSIIKMMAAANPETLAYLNEQIEWHKKQVECLQAFGAKQ